MTQTQATEFLAKKKKMHLAAFAIAYNPDR